MTGCSVNGVNVIIVTPYVESSWESYFVGQAALGMLLNIPTRFQESAADLFAYSLADMNALIGGISFFESEELDSLWNIEEKQLSPFVQADSALGKWIQAFFKNLDEKQLQEDRDTKLSTWGRWIYDYNHGPTHPGSSVRAQSIRDEINRRLQESAQQAA